ncbi:MAG: hypothetical protein WB443_12550, partial [Nitrososphaeraceae archaeon]
MKMSMSSGSEESALKGGYYRLMLYAGLFGGQTDLIPVIVIGAVTGFIVSKAVAPLLPKPRPQLGSNKQ